MRDPRIDPRPGDVVVAPGPHAPARTVIERDGDKLLWESVWPTWEGQDLRTDGECSLDWWIFYNANAEVMVVAEEDKP